MTQYRIDGEITQETAQGLRLFLEQNEGRPVVVAIASYGGDVGAAVEMSHAMARHGDVTLMHDSWNASAATWLFGARRIQIYEDCMLYIHCTSTDLLIWRQLNAEQMRALAGDLAAEVKTLEQADAIIARKYAGRTAGEYTPEQMLALMQQHPWLTAEECLRYHLVDEVIAEKTPTRVSRNTLRAMRNALIPMPEGLEQAAERGLVRQVIDGIRETMREIFRPENNNPINPQTTTIMDKTYTFVQNVLHIEGLEVCDGKVTLTTQQMADINTALEQADTLRTENEQLRERLDRVPDGAVTPPAVTTPGADAYADIRIDPVNFFEM